MFENFSTGIDRDAKKKKNKENLQMTDGKISSFLDTIAEREGSRID